MTNDRDTFVDLLIRSGVDYDASEKDVVLVETDHPNIFAEMTFGDPGPLKAIRILDYNEVRGA